VQVAIVDDTWSSLALLEGLVSKIDGLEVVSFTEPVAGLDWCLAHRPDLLIVDYRMPELDGLQFIGGFRALPERDATPILMVTSDDEREVRLRALELGATDFLSKPVDPVELTSRVKNMLALRRSHLSLARHAEELTAEVARATAEIRARESEIVYRLSRAAEFRDPETGAHILRMAHYAELVAKRLGQPAAFCKTLLEAAPMHDVGKLGIPDQILLKPAKLTPAEFEVMKTHTTIGWQILRGSSSPMLELAAGIALGHHEKFDGGGYPKGLRGEEIPVAGRIVAVADVFDALTSVRPYKPAWELPRAVGELKAGSGRHFDPSCVEAFLGSWDDVLAIRDRFRDG
jgi:putative two-component system response regulator